MLSPDLPFEIEVEHFAGYARRLSELLGGHDWTTAVTLAAELVACVRTQRQVFIAGNGGSSANAVHLANDLLYAWSKQQGRGIRVHALPANSAILTCLANDEGYDEVFSAQIAALADAGDVLIVLSGSGNSKNILRALEQARMIGMKSFAVLGFDGGKAKALCDVAVHFQTDNMQMAEDAQLVLGHMITRYLHDCRDSLG